jgi:hypothetical protein
MSNIELFTQAREYLVSILEPLIECYLTGIWDPHIKYVLIKETNQIIDRDLGEKFPDLPAKHRPQTKFRIFEEDTSIECGIQNYVNSDSQAMFLGTAAFMDSLFDFYYRIAYDPRFDYVFIARYGHTSESYFQGSKTAKVEYKTGQVTPLSTAYGMALEDGYIS